MEADFYSLGGDSIHSLQVVARASAQGISVTIEKLLKCSTIRALAAAASGSVGPHRPTKPFELVPTADHSRTTGLQNAYPLTHLQEGMLFHREIDPDVALYHDVMSYRVRVPIEEQAIRTEVQALFRRHDARRTSFDLGASVPVQRVHQDVTVPLTIHDLRGLPADAQSEAVEHFVGEELRRGFDVAVPPLRVSRYIA